MIYYLYKFKKSEKTWETFSARQKLIIISQAKKY